MKPLIGITTLNETRPKKIFSAVSYGYVRSVYLAGGIPVLIPLIGDEQAIDMYINSVDAIIFSGGEDVSPLSYGENPIKQVTYTSPARDEHEILLFKKAMQKNIPILGICRGIQIINVANGGTLYQDVNCQIDGSLGHLPKDNPVDNLYHSVHIEKDSKLFDIFGEENLNVNSFHHQAVKKTGAGFKVSAKSSDGIIEGIEFEGKNFVIGVQWHPEDLTVKYPKFLKIFKALVEEAKK